ncbi:sodium-dependent bicarbonate transport family permease [Alkalimonas delamerensis]|uniref:Sodium-dependent bicarbonate transport family permease n=1 Tax=Alkalimonas delamerensis TaxID=265981 RepID=A0ABT9GRU5_9GAMM|nr:sodium-dependent bicarbonate transport family permease [Alkalimonas delamerensis]MDP4529696.1 sodium-dependent bicarbonate transport family permease [Alkalimonas delamerensis]
MPDIVVMFFLLGLLAGILRSDLTIPKAAYDTLSLLLMLTIGLKGGMALHGNLSWQLVPELGSVILIGALFPLLLYPVLRSLVRLSSADSASFAAHYGSASAGTFAVALAYAESMQLTIGAEVTLYLVMLELPAIMVALAIYRWRQSDGPKTSQSAIWHETLTNRGVVLLAGGVLIGYMYGPQQGSAVTELFTNAFKGVLALFLLEMGLTAAETLNRISLRYWRVICFALITPVLLAVCGIFTGIWLGLPDGSILILASLTASASYIAAPVAIRTAIPQADIGLSLLAALGITFPLNVLLGIPMYLQFIQWLH